MCNTQTYDILQNHFVKDIYKFVFYKYTPLLTLYSSRIHHVLSCPRENNDCLGAKRPLGEFGLVDS